MSEFIVSALKYRPQAFTDVVGQQAITKTLQNAIDLGKIAKAMLFCGPRGVGKTTCARIFAKKINSLGADIDPNEDFAFNVFELDAASNNSVDDIRSLIEKVQIPPQKGSYKVYIIDEVHMLSTAAFNAFLKTLEEPPQHALFILATTEKQKIIPTILSRCQIFDFKRISTKDAQDYLKVIADREGVDAEDKALHLIAQKADGAMRDALSIFDRMISYVGEKLTAKHVSLNLNILDYDSYLDITELLHNGDLHNSILRFNQLLALGFDGYHFINGLSKHFRDLMMCQNEGTTQLLEVDTETEVAFKAQAKQVSKTFLLDALDLTNKYALQYKNSLHPHLQVELCLMQVASLNEDEKKNSKHYIKPFDGVVAPKTAAQKQIEASSTSVENSAEAVLTPAPEAIIQPSETVENPVEKDGEKNQQTEIPTDIPEKEETIQLDLSSQGVSGLSLSSLKVKKEHKNKVVSASEDKEVRDNEVNQESIEKHWKKFTEIITVNGERNMVALLQLGIPRLKNKVEIHYAVPNDTNRVELEKNSNELMGYLRDQLSNDALTLKLYLELNETKKFIYTNEEKYKTLSEKNPNLEQFKKKFNLEF
ncbi:MAG: DNA polymerase III subunit gamma/tau [Flavobacteriaceae bacterium]|jgi:DNA polymerase-3 subunit gamma/tau|tara:strand:- start:2916 stop:4697 length:1782 start_codon:yes stop_codon:yes gene_type:complete